MNEFRTQEPTLQAFMTEAEALKTAPRYLLLQDEKKTLCHCSGNCVIRGMLQT